MKGIFNFKAVRYRILPLLIFFISCKEQPRTPPGILSKEEMVNVLSEVYITEEKISRLSLEFDSAQEVFYLMRDDIARKTGIPDSTFQRSLRYYGDRPVQIQEIYAALIDSLQLREQRMNRSAKPK